MMFRAVVFTFMPTAIELILVCTLLAQRFRPAVALAVLVTFVAYVWWTTVMTKVHAAAAAIVLCSALTLAFPCIQHFVMLHDSLMPIFFTGWYSQVVLISLMWVTQSVTVM